MNEAVPNKGFIEAHENLVDSLDYECELAVVIGRMRRTSLRVRRQIIYSVIRLSMMLAQEMSRRAISSGILERALMVLHLWDLVSQLRTVLHIHRSFPSAPE